MMGAAGHAQQKGYAFPTGWLYIDAVHYVECPMCRAPKDFHCVTPKGQKSGTPHVARLQALTRAYPEIAGNAK